MNRHYVYTFDSLLRAMANFPEIKHSRQVCVLGDRDAKKLPRQDHRMPSLFNSIALYTYPFIEEGEVMMMNPITHQVLERVYTKYGIEAARSLWEKLLVLAKELNKEGR